MKNGRPAQLFPLLAAIGHPLAEDQRRYEELFCQGHWREQGGGRVWQAQGASRLEELRRLTRPLLLHRRKQDCLDLPPKHRRLVARGAHARGGPRLSASAARRDRRLPPAGRPGPGAPRRGGPGCAHGPAADRFGLQAVPGPSPCHRLPGGGRTGGGVHRVSWPRRLCWRPSCRGPWAMGLWATGPRAKRRGWCCSPGVYRWGGGRSWWKPFRLAVRRC